MEQSATHLSIIDPGAKPLHAFRMPEVSLDRRLRIDVDLTTYPKGPKKARRVDKVAFTVKASIDGGGDGPWLMTSLVEDATLVESSANTVHHLDSMVGKGRRTRISPSGVVLTTELLGDPMISQYVWELHGALSEAHSWLVLPFPSEPVGIGARWKTMGKWKRGVESIEHEQRTASRIGITKTRAHEEQANVFGFEVHVRQFSWYAAGDVDVLPASPLIERGSFELHETSEVDDGIHCISSKTLTKVVVSSTH